MMTDLGSCGPEIVGCVPGTEVGTIESHPTGRYVQESRHDDAGIRGTIHPFSLRKASDTINDKPIVGPADQIHYGRKIGRGRNRIEQSEGRELRGDQAVSRPWRGCECIRHRKTISASS
jgi:hypothetical protein